MPRNKTFFTPGACEDPDYKAIRDLSQAADCKRFVEELWQDYELYSDTNFLSNARNHFHQRFWEMYLCVTMLKRGFVIEKANGSQGPEFSISIEGRKVWFEAIAPEAGSTEDRVPEVEIGKGNSVPTEQVLMRYTAALSAKLRKYQCDRKKGIISENDGYVVAINSNKIPHAFLGSILPYHVQSFLPFGPLTIAINTKTREKVDEYFQYRGEVTKKNNSPVPTQAFLDPAYCGISAVIHSIFDVAGYTRGTAKWGDDFDVLHNPLAVNPLPFDVLHWCKYRYVHDGKLETVERSQWLSGSPPASGGSTPWFKQLLNNPEWQSDPVGKARDEAHKVIDELRDENKGE